MIEEQINEKLFDFENILRKIVSEMKKIKNIVNLIQNETIPILENKIENLENDLKSQNDG